MRLSVTILIPLIAALSLGASKPDPIQDELDDLIASLPKEKIHEWTVAVETDPLSKSSERKRSVLLIYFDKMPAQCEACTNYYEPVLRSKNRLHTLVWLQGVISTCDFVAQTPGGAADREASMLAGLEGALRAYTRILAARPKVRMVELDNLVTLQARGELPDYIRGHMCEQK